MVFPFWVDYEIKRVSGCISDHCFSVDAEDHNHAQEIIQNNVKEGLRGAKVRIKSVRPGSTRWNIWCTVEEIEWEKAKRKIS